MAALIIALIFVLAISMISEVHALGLWFFMMITHAVWVDVFGAAVEHLPMLAGLIIMASTVVRRKWTGMPVSVFLLLSALVAFISMAAISGLDPVYSIERLVRYSKGFVLAVFVGGVIRDSGQIRVITLYCLAAVLVGDSIAINEYFTGEFTVDNYQVRRAGGLSGDPNDAAMLLLTGIPLAVYWFMHSEKKFSKVLSAGVFILTIGAITLTQSRGGGVALVLILLFLFFRRPSIKAFAVGIAFVSVGLLFASAEYWERMESLTTATDSDDKSLDMRYEFVTTGIEIFLENPILGVGMGNFGKALVQHKQSFNFREDDAAHVAHNMYLEFFVENPKTA